MHRLPAHTGMPLTNAPEQARPQPPQLPAELARFTSHPSSAAGATGWLQLPNVPEQVDVHRPLVHDAALTLASEQARPQVPQLAVALLKLTSQPSSSAGAAGWLQLPNVPEQVDVHRPPVHAATLTLLSEQVRPQAPQLPVELRSVSQPSSAVGAAGCVQLPKPAEQAELHRPPAHDGAGALFAEQPRPHAPQLVLEVVRSTSQPSSGAGATGWLQLPKPTAQLEVHTPAAQLRTAVLVEEQPRPHAPQLAVVLVELSQPSVLAPTLMQSPKPGLQVYEQLVPSHAGALALTALHTLPQPPQLERPVRSVSQPLVSGAVVTQSPCPALHEL